MSELPGGWVQTSLGALCSRPQYGWTTSARKGPSAAGSLRFLRTTDITHGRLDWTSVPFCKEEPPRPEKYALAPGDIVISRAGSVGFSYRIAEVQPAVFASYLIRFRPDDQVDGRYLAYFLQSPSYWQQIRAATSGITLANVNAKKLATIELPLAPLAEQGRIVAAIEEQFSRLDAAEAALERARKRIEQMRAAISHAATTGRLLQQDPDDTPTAIALDRAWASGSTKVGAYPVRRSDGLQPLPPSWQWVHWEDILANGKESFRRGPFGSALTKASFVEVGYKIYEQHCPINDDCSFARYYIPADRFRELASFAVMEDDFLISCSGTLGRITQVPTGAEEGVINQALLRVRINFDLIDSAFFLLLFRSPYVQGQLLRNSTGTAMANVKGVKELKAIPMPLPPLAEQRRLVAEASRLESLVGNLWTALNLNSARAARLRASILSTAFAGALVAQDPNDEPSSVLLERIASEPASSDRRRPSARSGRRKTTV
jgi:type I restriction enzyme, S subunit